MFDASYARSVFSYDPETGVITWKVSTGPRARVGARAGRVREKDGYRHLKHGGKMILEHRLAWLLHTGEWPENELDHRDGDRANNRIANLREATRSENNRNALKPPRALPRGVTCQDGLFLASISTGGERVYLGTYETAKEAGEVYAAFAKMFHGEFAARGI